MEIHHFYPFSSSRGPTSIFQKKLHFQAKFLAILAKFHLLRHKFEQNFVPETSVSSQEISSGDTILKTWAAHTYPKFFGVPPPERAHV